MTNQIKALPPLPESLSEVRAMFRGEFDYASPGDEYFTASQMRAYGALCRADLTDQAGAPTGSREAFDMLLASTDSWAGPPFAIEDAWTIWQAGLASKAAAQPNTDVHFSWESTTVAYKRYVTHAQYQKYSANVQRWYKPICQKCHANSEALLSQPAQPVKMPSTPEDVIAFIGSNFNSMQDRHDSGQKLTDMADVTYSLTVHDLLSAFQDLRDFGGEAAQPVGTTREDAEHFYAMNFSFPRGPLHGHDWELFWSAWQHLTALLSHAVQVPSKRIADCCCACCCGAEERDAAAPLPKGE